MNRPASLIVPVVLLFAALSTAVYHAGAHIRITTNITWAKDIRPILREKCMPCHHRGGMAPEHIDLTTYGMKQGKSGARDWAKAIEEMVLTRRMPPWKPDPRFGSFANSRTLTQQEIEIIVSWSRGGAPQGTPRDLPPPEDFKKREWLLGQPDLVLRAPQEHVIPAKNMSDFHSFRVAVPIEEDRWITAYEFMPGDPVVVHSIQAFIHDSAGARPKAVKLEIQKKYDPLASEDEARRTRERTIPEGPHYLGEWTRGDRAVLLPDSAGRLLRKGSTVEMQITYFKPGPDDFEREFRDLSQLGLHFAKNEEVDLLVESRKVSTEHFRLPPGRDRQEIRASATFEENVHLLAVHPQLGLLGKDLEIRAGYPDGKELTLLWIPEYEQKWESSYLFERPIPAPSGTKIQLVAHFDNSAGNPQNPANPPREAKAGKAPEDPRLVAWFDYMLDDHMIATTRAIPPATEEPTAATKSAPGAGESVSAGGLSSSAGLPSSSEKGEREILEKFKDQIAARTNEWTRTDSGRDEVYWCPNRGRPDHSLKNYYASGRCEICSEPLLHQSRFQDVRTWTCATASCRLRETVFYSPGRCPGCGEPVESLGHMDHNPVHGGILFMAENKYHHIEGTHPAPDEFRVYFYDDYKKPLDPRNFSGRTVIEEWDESRQAFTERHFPLVIEKEGNGWLTSRIPAPKKYPVELIPRISLAGEEKLFNFFFNGLTREPDAKESKPIRLHAHGDRPPVPIPDLAADVVREILKRDRIIRSRIESKDWFGLHVPAFDTIDLARALKLKMEGLSPRQRRKLGEAVVALSTWADRLDKAGDASDEGRVAIYYTDFSKSLQELLALFPEASR